MRKVNNSENRRRDASSRFREDQREEPSSPLLAPVPACAQKTNHAMLTWRGSLENQCARLGRDQAVRRRRMQHIPTSPRPPQTIIDPGSGTVGPGGMWGTTVGIVGVNVLSVVPNCRLTVLIEMPASDATVNVSVKPPAINGLCGPLPAIEPPAAL